ncbi:MAG: hypothetical protein Tsb0015_01670 [Simkaniaceae bacterium]
MAIKRAEHLLNAYEKISPSEGFLCDKAGDYYKKIFYPKLKRINQEIKELQR